MGTVFRATKCQPLPPSYRIEISYGMEWSEYFPKGSRHARISIHHKRAETGRKKITDPRAKAQSAIFFDRAGFFLTGHSFPSISPFKTDLFLHDDQQLQCFFWGGGKVFFPLCAAASPDPKRPPPHVTHRFAGRSSGMWRPPRST